MAYKDGSRLRGGRAYRQHSTLKGYIRERDNYTCQLCGREGWIVDHINPWRVSRDSTIANLQVLCHACNLKTRRKPKNANPFHTLDDWYSYLEKELSDYNA